LDQETATLIIKQQFVEVIIAPSVAKKAREIISTKKNIRLLECGELTRSNTRSLIFFLVEIISLAFLATLGAIMTSTNCCFIINVAVS
jgi:AICAR transformylase/IMP cyclohydrolase PurH